MGRKTLQSLFIEFLGSMYLIFWNRNVNSLFLHIISQCWMPLKMLLSLSVKLTMTVNSYVPVTVISQPTLPVKMMADMMIYDIYHS